jgi:poly-D-alanine transfer protein DltD
MVYDQIAKAFGQEQLANKQFNLEEAIWVEQIKTKKGRLGKNNAEKAREQNPFDFPKEEND